MQVAMEAQSLLGFGKWVVIRFVILAFYSHTLQAVVLSAK